MATDARKDLLNAAPEEVDYVFVEPCPNKATYDVWFVVRDVCRETIYQRAGRWWSRLLRRELEAETPVAVRTDDYPRKILNAQSDILQRLLHHFKLGDELWDRMGWDRDKGACARTITDEERHHLPGIMVELLKKHLVRKHG